MNLRTCFWRLRNAAIFRSTAWRSFPRILLMPSTFSTLSACGADGRSSVPNGCRGRANISTHSVSCGNAYVRRNGGDRYVDSNCFDEN